MLHSLVHFAKAQRRQGQFLTLGFVNGAFDQSNFNLTHLFKSYEL